MNPADCQTLPDDVLVGVFHHVGSIEPQALLFVLPAV
jgi:hypothetical protein